MTKDGLLGTADPVGVCGLCQRRRTLRDSHLLPAAVYKMLRDSEHRNPNPVMVTAAHAGPTTRQVSAYSLCQECEQRFSRKGERYVLSQCARQPRMFLLRERLRRDARSVPVAPGVWLAEVADLFGDHVDDYLCFAAGVFWKASARVWDPSWTPFSLGDKYQEQFRLYLLDQAEWPVNARLVLRISTDELVDFAVNPVSAKMGSAHRYKFCIPGILFTLLVGATVPREYDVGALNSTKGRLYL